MIQWCMAATLLEHLARIYDTFMGVSLCFALVGILKCRSRARHDP